MKYFLSVFDSVYLGIPSECTERVISVSRKQSSVYETEKQEAYISLPLLFKRSDVSSPHGIVLKAANEEIKTILLAPPLDIDTEISDEDIHDIPKAFSGILRYCKGACFIGKAHGERLILTLDVEKITKDFTRA